MTPKASAAPSLALTSILVVINALELAADVAMETEKWLIGAAERFVIDLTALVTIGVHASATMGVHAVHVKPLVRYVYFTLAASKMRKLTSFRFDAHILPALRLATRRALHVSRNVLGLVLIKDLVQCHAQRHATASLAMNDAPEYFPAVINAQVSAEKTAPLVIVRSAATKVKSELMCWSSYPMPRLI